MVFISPCRTCVTSVPAGPRCARSDRRDRQRDGEPFGSSRRWLPLAPAVWPGVHQPAAFVGGVSVVVNLADGMTVSRVKSR